MEERVIVATIRRLPSRLSAVCMRVSFAHAPGAVKSGAGALTKASTAGYTMLL